MPGPCDKGAIRGCAAALGRGRPAGQAGEPGDHLLSGVSPDGEPGQGEDVIGRRLGELITAHAEV